MSDSNTISPYAVCCFNSLDHALTNCPLISLTHLIKKYPPKQSLKVPSSSPLFVTWHKDGNLRGCIGTFASHPLNKGIPKYALIAAMEDPRFSPVQLKELKHLSVDVSLLCGFKTIYKKTENKAEDLYNWEVGVHGVEIKYKSPIGGTLCSATFLPNVAEEQGWDKETTLRYLVGKGLGSDDIYDPDILKVMQHLDKYVLELIRYESVKSSLTYDEYQSIKNDQEEES